MSDVVLPKWIMTHAWGEGDVWACNLTLRANVGGPKYSCAKSNNLGRAWLIAMINELILET